MCSLQPTTGTNLLTPLIHANLTVPTDCHPFRSTCEVKVRVQSNCFASTQGDTSKPISPTVASNLLSQTDTGARSMQYPTLLLCTLPLSSARAHKTAMTHAMALVMAQAMAQAMTRGMPSLSRRTPKAKVEARQKLLRRAQVSEKISAS